MAESNGKAHETVYRRICDVLREEILSRYQPGQFIQTEHELSRRFGVNRHTVRRAVEELMAEGLVVRKHGRGAMVLRREILCEFPPDVSFADPCLAVSSPATGKVLRAVREPAQKRIASELQMTPGEEVIALEVKRVVNTAPISVTSHYFPARRFEALLDSYQRGSLHEHIRLHFGIELVRIRSTLGAGLPSESDANELAISRRRPIILVESLNGIRESGEAVEYAIARYNADGVRIVLPPGETLRVHS